MPDADAGPALAGARPNGARIAARVLAGAAAALVAYAAWRGYQNPDFLLGIGQALGLC